MAILEVGFPLHKPYPYSLNKRVYLYFRYVKFLLTIARGYLWVSYLQESQGWTQ